MTKPTSLAQGRVAHLIEWKGWPKPTAPPSSAHAHFSSYCHLTEGEKEARFAAGIHLPDSQGGICSGGHRQGSTGPSCLAQLSCGVLSRLGLTFCQAPNPLNALPCRWSAPPAAPSPRRRVVVAADGGLLDTLLEHFTAHRRYKSSCCLAMTHPV